MADIGMLLAVAGAGLQCSCDCVPAEFRTRNGVGTFADSQWVAFLRNLSLDLVQFIKMYK